MTNIVNALPGTHSELVWTILSDSNLWYQLPFVETFETRNLGDLNGQRGWISSNAVVQSDVVYAGQRAAELTMLTNSLSHDFDRQHGHVWTDVRVKPVFGSPGAVPADATAAMYVDTDGNVWAYDGASRRKLTPPAPTLTEGQWVRFTWHADYGNSTWDLYVNGKIAGEDLDFYSAATPEVSAFGVQAAGVTNGHLKAHVDNVWVGLHRPLDIGRDVLIIIR